jgi:hypothetical protein
VRARKLAEAVAAVNELLLQASSSVNTALAAPDATAGQLTDLMSQVRMYTVYMWLWHVGTCIIRPRKLQRIQLWLR